jgi:hypothetical protein
MRIYFDGNPHRGYTDDPDIHFVDRSIIERDGSIYHRKLYKTLHLYDTQLKLRRLRPLRPNVNELRRKAAGSHPDRGGDTAEFRQAYAEYARAKQVAR